MPNYRRAYVPGGSFFFTLVTNRRAPLFSQALGRRLLGSMFRRCLLRWPFTINALVLLPEHLHAIWSLPPGDIEYPKRWGWIKKEFTKEWLREGGPRNRSATAASANDGEECGNRDTGRIHWKTKRTSSATSTTFTSIRSNMGMLSALAIGRGLAFIGSWRRASILCTGLVQTADSTWTSVILMTMLANQVLNQNDLLVSGDRSFSQAQPDLLGYRRSQWREDIKYNRGIASADDTESGKAFRIVAT